jgi:nonribosomal peptide synthetase DhbF
LRRLDDQVKIRAQRLELGEVEARLSTHPVVARAAVVKAGDGAGERLVAFVIPVASLSSLPDGFALELQDHLRELLPGYMVPDISG